MLSQEKNILLVKLSEAAKATNLGNTKTLHKPSTYVKNHYITLGELIKDSSYQFYFGDTPNWPSNNDIIDKDHHTDNDGDTFRYYIGML